VRAKIVADRTAWIRRMAVQLRALPIHDFETFRSDPRNLAAAESHLRRALEALLDLGRHLGHEAAGYPPTLLDAYLGAATPGQAAFCPPASSGSATSRSREHRAVRRGDGRPLAPRNELLRALCVLILPALPKGAGPGPKHAG
jgi:hypothetical protein